MTAFTDPRTLASLDRWRAADHIRAQYDVVLPQLSTFNYDPCPQHAQTGPDSFCLSCGVQLRRHQRVGAAWLFMRPAGLLADSVGTGKTAQVAWLLAACRQTGELSLSSRAVVICKANAVLQWRDQLRKMTRGLRIEAAEGPAQRRVATYLTSWEVCVLSDRTFTPRGGTTVQTPGDVSYLRQFPVSIVVFDDIDPMRRHENRTARAIKAYCTGKPRVYGLHGTPQQKRLIELHSFLEPVGGTVALGSQRQMHERFVEVGTQFYKAPALICARDHLNPPGTRRCGHVFTDEPGQPSCGLAVRKDQTGRKVTTSVGRDVGVRNLEELQRLIAPYILRRRASDVDDVSLPAIQRNIIWVSLLPEQRRRYDLVRQGMLRRLRDHGEEITQVEAAAAFTRGWQICSGLAALDDGRDISVKLDWAADKLDGELADEKVVVFVNFRPNVAALSARLNRLRIGHVLYWSEEPNARVRHERLTRWRTDPDCKVIVGTTSMEQSLNLQTARHLIMVDSILNPARMEQFAGRVRRQGSVYQTVYVHQLLARETQEDGYPDLLMREQAVTNAIFGESSDLFRVSPRQLAALVAGV